MEVLWGRIRVTSSRPYGTFRLSNVYPGLRPGLSSAVPAGLILQSVGSHARQNLGQMLNQVQCRNDSIVINKHGKPVAALVSAELFARIRSMRDRFDALSKRVAEASAEVPVEEGLAEIDTLLARNRQILR
jgi:prevent-host-death family protein